MRSVYSVKEGDLHGPLVSKKDEKRRRREQKPTSRMWRKDRLSRINSTKKRQGRNERERKRGGKKMGKIMDWKCAGK